MAQTLVNGTAKTNTTDAKELVVGMEPNRKVPGDIIYGSFFVVGAQGEDFASLSDEHIAYYTKVFADTSKPDVDANPMWRFFFGG